MIDCLTFPSKSQAEFVSPTRIGDLNYNSLQSARCNEAVDIIELAPRLLQ